MKPAKRITLKWGARRFKIIVSDAPFPTYGDTCIINELPWRVVRVEDAVIVTQLQIRSEKA